MRSRVRKQAAAFRFQRDGVRPLEKGGGRGGGEGGFKVEVTYARPSRTFQERHKHLFPVWVYRLLVLHKKSDVQILPPRKERRGSRATVKWLCTGHGSTAILSKLTLDSSRFEENKEKKKKPRPCSAQGNISPCNHRPS